jgi:hypothetical protein
MGGQPATPATERFGGGDHQGVQLPLGVGGGLDRGAACRQPHRQRRSLPGGSWLGELVTTQRLVGCPGGIDRVGLGAVAADGALGPVELDNLLMMSMQEPGQSGAVAAGALDRPHPLARLLVGQLEQLLVAGRGRRHRRLVDGGAGGGDHDRSGVGVLVGVDPDDEVHQLCQDGHALPACPETT